MFTLLAWAAALLGDFARLAAVSAVARLVFSAATCLAVPVLRRKMPAAERRFRVPGGLLVPAAAAGLSLWLLTGLVLLALSAWRGGLNTIAGWFGVQTYPPAVLFAVALLFVLAVLLHYSTVISKISDQNVILAQRVALLELELSERDQAPEPPAAAAPGTPAS